MGKEKQSTQQPEEVSAERSFVADFFTQIQTEYLFNQTNEATSSNVAPEELTEEIKEEIKEGTKEHAKKVLNTISESPIYKERVSAELIRKLEAGINQGVENLAAELASHNKKLKTVITRAKKKKHKNIEWAGQEISINRDEAFWPMTAALNSKFTKQIDILQDETKTGIDIESVIKSIMDKPPSLFQKLVNGISNSMQQIRDGLKNTFGGSRSEESALAKNDSPIKTEPVDLGMQNQQQQVQQQNQLQPEKQNSQRLNKTKQLAQGVSRTLAGVRKKFIGTKTTDTVLSVKNPNQEQEKGGIQ
ncbi:MAG: hypothetical protein P8P83_00600 [Rickettsiaceae bacterium]|nr:hypothetical protein [Rickettsiaceae bacterium]